MCRQGFGRFRVFSLTFFFVIGSHFLLFCNFAVFCGRLNAVTTIFFALTIISCICRAFWCGRCPELPRRGKYDATQ